MKKLLLLSTVLLGAATASQAGLSVGIGIGFPFPLPVIIRRPAPVIVQAVPPVYAPAPVVVGPPCANVVPAPVVIAPRPGYYRYRPYLHRGWEHSRGYRH